MGYRFCLLTAAPLDMVVHASRAGTRSAYTDIDDPDDPDDPDEATVA